MNTVKTWQINSTSAEETEALAAKLAKNLRGGEVIELVSDLGGGKTTFVRGLAQGLDSTDMVSSPTFKISNQYKSPRYTIYHFDFYRLSEPGLIANELAEVLNQPDGIVVIEWGEVIRDVLPARHLRVEIESRGQDERHLTFQCPDSLAYLLKGIAP